MNIINNFYRIKNIVFNSVRGIDLFFVWAIIWISIDGFPYIPINTNNRPISIFFLFIYWLLIKFKSPKFNKFEIYSFLFLLILVIFSAFQSFVFFGQYRALTKFIITGSLSYLTINTCYLFLVKYINKYSVSYVVTLITYIFILSSILPIGIGMLQLIALQFSSTRSFLDPIFFFFSHDASIYNQNRLNLISNEPAQAGTYILYVFCYVYSFYNRNSRFYMIYLSILLIILVFINSSVTYIILGLFLFFKWLILEPKKPIYIIRTFFVSTAIITLVYITSSFFLTEYTSIRFTQVAELFMNFSLDSWITIASMDFSILDRFGTPIFGFISLYYTNFIGTGGEGFFLVYEEIVYNLFPDLINNPYLSNQFIDNIHMTVKFLPSKIAAEFGVIGLLLFCYATHKIFKRHYQNFINTKEPIYKGLCFCMIYCILASYMASYFHFSTILTFMLCYVSSLKTHNN